MIDRREWLAAAGVALPICAMGIDPIERPKGSRMRLSLAAYSFNRQLRLGKTATMTLEEFIDFSGTLPLDAVELTSYYFPTTDRKYLAERKRQCTLLGLDVSGTAVGNDFCVKGKEELKKQLDLVKSWVEYTSILGGKAIRIFAGKVPKGGDEDEARKQATGVIQEACEYAGKFGVFLALENHGGITASAEQLLSIVKGVDSPWFGVNLDTGNFRTADPYGDLRKLAPYAVNVQVKVEISPMGKKKEEADIPRLIQMLRDVNYHGYVALEYEGSADPKAAVPEYVNEMRKLIDG